MSKQTRYEYALVDTADGFTYEVVNTRSYAREKKRDWNESYPEHRVSIVQRKFKLEVEKTIR